MMIYNPNVDLVNDNVYTKFGLNKSIHSEDIEKKIILTSIKGSYSIANLQKMMIYNPNIDLINDKCVYKICLNSVHSFSRY